MAKRRAPKDGYDNPEKRKYRHEVWKRLSKKAIPILENNENAKVLMLPSEEGLEIDVAIKFGIKPEQIIAIDENPALLAHAKWKSKIPKSNRFGCKVSEVGKKIKNNGWVLAAANLDFCNNFSDELVYEIQSLFDTCPMVNNFNFSVTMMKGRETKALLTLINKIGIENKFTEPRLETLFHVLDIYDNGINVVYEDSYYDTSPMIYCIVERIKNTHVTLTDKIINEYHNLIGIGEDVVLKDKKSQLGVHIDKYEDEGIVYVEKDFVRIPLNKRCKMQDVGNYSFLVKENDKYQLQELEHVLTIQEARRIVGLANKTNRKNQSVIWPIKNGVTYYWSPRGQIKKEKDNEFFTICWEQALKELGIRR